jgi:phosphatidylserine/phosphatidylglycerophosphate/cardiolipin synthase-like enzyme
MSTNHPLTDLTVLDKFAAAPFPPGTNLTRRTFYSPVDDIHGCLLFLINSAQRSLDLAMFGFNDPELAAAIKAKLEDPAITVRLSLDKTQAGGVHEKAVLARADYPASDIAIGTSERGALMHLKELVIDATILVNGSTNYGTSAEVDQDNQLTVAIDSLAAGLAVERHSAIHAHMIAQMKAVTQ